MGQCPDEIQRVSETQFRLLTDAMSQIVWVMRADGAYTWFNQRWLDYTGLSMEESLGRGLTGLVHPDDDLRGSRLPASGAGARKRRALRDRIPAAPCRRCLPLDVMPRAPAA